jgi:hypothetical protein
MTQHENQFLLPPFVPMFMGLKSHIKKGRITPVDLAIYLMLHYNCDFETGIVDASAREIMFWWGGKAPFGTNKEETAVIRMIQDFLGRLRQNKYINYDGIGEMSGYSILIHKYLIRTGDHQGMYLDAFAPSSLKDPVFIPSDGEFTDPFSPPGTDRGVSGDLTGTERGPNGH